MTRKTKNEKQPASKQAAPRSRRRAHTARPEIASESVRAGVSRRGFIRGVGLAAGGASTVAGARGLQAQTNRGAETIGPAAVQIFLEVNGKKRSLKIEPRVTLLRALRNSLDLTGTKQICDRGACGGCTVLVDGQRVNSCMTLALDVVGKKIETVEGIAQGDKLHPIQEAFCELDALQCGFCTPGFVVACKSIYDKAKASGQTISRAEIKKELSGNICRCGTYNRIFDAVEKVVNRKA